MKIKLIPKNKEDKKVAKLAEKVVNHIITEELFLEHLIFAWSIDLANKEVHGNKRKPTKD